MRDHSSVFSQLEARAAPPDLGPGSELLAAMIAELRALYGPPVIGRTPSAHPDEMSPPGGAFLVVYGDGEPVACGGVKRLDEGVGEIKRMYVRPEARSRGVARFLLGALEDAARELGYSCVRLDTGGEQPHARALYESAGYVAIPDYNDNAYASYWGEKRL
jgi:GNAT superfamily N-acetyltransferase